MKGNRYSNMEFFRQANWNGSFVIVDYAKGEAKMVEMVHNIHVHC